MADKKISALTSSTTPLAGSEVLPIVQSGATVKTTVDSVVNGRTIAPTNITGTTTNNSASAGSVGEYVSSAVLGPGSSYVSGFTAITSVSLTAGDWDVDCYAGLNQSSGKSDFIYIQFGLSTLNNDITGFASIYGNNFNPANATAYYIDWQGNPHTQRISLAATTTIYLVFRAGFTSGTVGLYGGIRARRVR